MPVVDKEILIELPKRIFRFVSIPGYLLDLAGLIEIKNEKLLPNGGYRFRWLYKIFGYH